MMCGSLTNEKDSNNSNEWIEKKNRQKSWNWKIGIIIGIFTLLVRIVLIRAEKKNITIFAFSHTALHVPQVKNDFRKYRQ